MTDLRVGNIVFYQDYATQGYPICVRDLSLHSFNTVYRINPDGFKVMIHPMPFRFADFWTNNNHLKCSDSDVPIDIKHLHVFMNWYEDTFGEQPKIYKGKQCLNL